MSDALSNQTSAAPLSACVVGLGNIGSQLVPLLARGRRFRTLTLIDPERFDEGNLRTQNIRPDDVGFPKSAVLADAARAIDPTLRINAIHAAVEDVPIGRLRSDVVFSGPDSRVARQHVNRIAWRLGVRAWVDAGIEPAAHLVRVSLFTPRDEAPCMECAWGPDDYRAMGVRASCLEAATSAPVTNGPPALGALAAARAALLADEVLGSADGCGGLQVTMAVREHRLAVTSFRRVETCRFDHGSLPLETLTIRPTSVTLRHLDALAPSSSSRPDWRLEVDGCDFAACLLCGRCGAEHATPYVLRPASGAGLRCGCGGRYTSPALSRAARLERMRLTADVLDRSMADLGLLPGDLVLLAAGHDARLVELVEPTGDMASRDAASAATTAVSGSI